MATERDPGCSCQRCQACFDPRLMERVCRCYLEGVFVGLEVHEPCATTADGHSSLCVRGAAERFDGNGRKKGAGRL